MLNAVGIDVSKGKSTVAVMRPGEVVFRRPFDVQHTKQDLADLVTYIKGLEGDTKVLMESTGRYHLPILKNLTEADIFTSYVNPKLIKLQNCDANPLRGAKTDPLDAKKVCRYALDKWIHLRQYSAMDKTREQLKVMNTQYEFSVQHRTSMENNLISLLDLTYPGVNKLIDSNIRADGSIKWVDYICSFWHANCVISNGFKTFNERYQAFCKRNGYNYSEVKAIELYEAAKVCVPSVEKDEVYKELILNAAEQLKIASKAATSIVNKMNELASSLPEYSTVMEMGGVGKILGPQLIAEIGDVSRFSHRTAITAFAGVDPGANQSGDFNAKSNKASKSGSPQLRRTLFLIMRALWLSQPADDPVFAFMAKKKAEGKPWLVYMTAGANKFLRIYYGRVKEALAKQEVNCIDQETTS